MNSVGKLRFDYPDRSTPLETCIKLAGKARKIPDADMPNLVRHSFIRDAFDPKLMKSVSEMLCDLDRVNIFLHTPKSCLKTEAWMNT